MAYVPFIRNVSWGEPVLLPGAIAAPLALYTFQPRSNFCLFKSNYGPLILGEIVSDQHGSDRWKMLFEGMAVCRYQNMLRKDRGAIVLCFYLNNDYEMERYLVYQTEGAPRDVGVLLFMLWCQPD